MPALNASPDPSFRRFSPRRVATTGPTHGSPYPKLDVRARLAARLIDVAIALVPLFFLPPPGGALCAALFLIVADALFQGQSPGKKCLGIKVVRLRTRLGAGVRCSARRNALFALSALLTGIPGHGVWIAPLVATAIALIELIRARRHPLGQRLGDIWAGTQVIDGRDVRGEKARENAFSMLPAERISQASHVSRTAEGARIILDGQRPIGPVKEPARQRP